MSFSVSAVGAPKKVADTLSTAKLGDEIGQRIRDLLVDQLTDSAVPEVIVNLSGHLDQHTMSIQLTVQTVHPPYTGS